MPRFQLCIVPLSASFRDVLAASTSIEDEGSTDEEPIKVQVKKTNFGDFYEVEEEIGRLVY